VATETTSISATTDLIVLVECWFSNFVLGGGGGKKIVVVNFLVMPKTLLASPFQLRFLVYYYY
jgi:hypothetical protein